MKDSATIPLRYFPGDSPGFRISHHRVAAALGYHPGSFVRDAAQVFSVPMPTSKDTGGRGRPREDRWLTYGQAVQACVEACKNLNRLSRAVQLLDEAFNSVLQAKAETSALRDVVDPARTALREARATVVELEARLELQNRHLTRHADFTRETHEEIKDLKRQLASEKVERGAAERRERLARQQLESERSAGSTRVTELELDLRIARDDLARLKAKDAPGLDVAPTGKYARAGWFSYQIDEKALHSNRSGHGLELLSQLGVCDRRGVPTELGRRYCRPDGAAYKWDMALIEPMRLERAA